MIATENQETTLTVPETIHACIAALDSKKADDIRLLHVGHVSSITDYFIIVTGTSNPHLRALGEVVEETLDKQRIDSVTCGAGDQSGWVVVDAFDFIIHIFTAPMRKFYNLEGLWKDAKQVPVELDTPAVR